MARRVEHQVLRALERGEVDLALTDAPALELALLQRGLAHDRRPVALCDLLLLGPARRGQAAAEPPGLARGQDLVSAMSQLGRSGARFIGAPLGSGTQIAEAACWQDAQCTPQAPWYSSSAPDTDWLAAAEAEGAWTLASRPAWLAQRRAPLAVWAEAEAGRQLAVHVMRSFRVRHPAANLFVQWLTGPKGRAVVSRSAGWRLPPASG